MVGRDRRARRSSIPAFYSGRSPGQRDCLTDPSPGPLESARHISSTCSPKLYPTVSSIISNTDRQLIVRGGRFFQGCGFIVWRTSSNGSIASQNVRVARASCVLVSASRRNDLFLKATLHGSALYFHIKNREEENFAKPETASPARETRALTLLRPASRYKGTSSTTSRAQPQESVKPEPP